MIQVIDIHPLVNDGAIGIFDVVMWDEESGPCSVQASYSLKLDFVSLPEGTREEVQEALRSSDARADFREAVMARRDSLRAMA